MTEQILHSGEFNDYNGDIKRVTFYKLVDMQETPDVENDLTFSGSAPVIINYQGNTEDIYSPLKTSSCDVDIVSQSILDDLYSPKKDEIRMRVEKRITVSDRVLVFDSNGTVTSASIYNDLNNHTIETRTLFYTDINGDFRFIGRVADRHNNLQVANLIYRTSTHTWDWDDAWYLNLYDWYFHDGTNSYWVFWDSGDNRHYIEKWNGDDWDGNTHYYDKVENGEASDCGYGVENIIHFNDGIELWWGKKRYTWDAANYKWIQVTSYTDERIANYYSIYGSSYHRILDKQGNYIDTVIVNGASGYTYSNYIAKLDRTNLTYKCIIPLSNDSWNPDNVFEKDGYLYYVASEGAVYYWAWNIEEWVKWIEFTGDFTPNSFSLDYVVDTNKDVMIRYEKYLQSEFFLLTNITPPRVHYQETPIEYDYETIWEGYKIPNTYSQDITQNYDNISMTAIDPISIMKYVKIDQILEKPNTKTYGEILGKALAYVQFKETNLKVENRVSYGSNGYSGSNGILNLKCQVSNFWDEAGDPETIYSMIEEMLKPFCLCLTFDGNDFILYSLTNPNSSWSYEVYNIGSDGTLTFLSLETETVDKFIYNNGDWKDNNVHNAAIEIGSTYDKITAIANTCVPSYSNMAIDLIDYNNRDDYDVEYLNVQRNKSKGYVSSGGSASIDSSDHWYFLWNGVYTNEDYDLESHEGYVNGWLNINGAYKYLTGNSGHPNDYGNILNFYGGADNPTATGKTASTERYVKINKRITAYAPDNGTPLEFLEDSDIDWGFNGNVEEDYEGGANMSPELNKNDSSASKFGTSKDPTTTRIVYKQVYENIFTSDNQNSISFDLEQSYSRTGIDSSVNVMNNNTCTNAHFTYIDDYYMTDATMRYYPRCWNSTDVTIDTNYYSKYKTQYTLLRPSRVTPVWDKRKIYMYILLSDNTVLQFDGKQWVSDLHPESANAFYLLKLMNGEKLFHTDYRYNVIETADQDRYSLTDENFVYYTDDADGVTTSSVVGGSTYTYYKYKDESKDWYRWVDKCGEGSLNINVPEISDTGAKIIIEVYSSSLLGTTGQSSTEFLNVYERTWFLYPNSALGFYDTKIRFMPHNTTYVKAEHLNLNITVTVPESNLGQMFSQSDIKYFIDKSQGYSEEFTGPNFRVNTENSLVASSFSYILFGNGMADPEQFYINGIKARPECYTTQAYYNWLSKIRKIYSKTLVPTKNTTKMFNNIRTYLTSPEVPGKELMVISDSWDVKTNRHSIRAIDKTDLTVSEVETIGAIEVPRRARNERYNLPTVVKT